jgi:hypothetical protein
MLRHDRLAGSNSPCCHADLVHEIRPRAAVSGRVLHEGRQRHVVELHAEFLLEQEVIVRARGLVGLHDARPEKERPVRIPRLEELCEVARVVVGMHPVEGGRGQVRPAVGAPLDRAFVVGDEEQDVRRRGAVVPGGHAGPRRCQEHHQRDQHSMQRHRICSFLSCV